MSENRGTPRQPPSRGPRMRSPIHMLAEQSGERAHDTPRVVRRLLSYLQPYRNRFALVGLFILMVAVAAGAGPALIGLAIDKFISAGDRVGLQWTIAGLAAVYAANFVAFRGQIYTLGWISAHMLFNLRTDLFRAIQRLSLRYYDQHPAGDLMSRLVNDVEQVGTFLGEGLARTIGSLLSLTGMVVAMFALDWRLALAALAILPLMVLTTDFFGKWARRAFRQTRETIGDVSANLEEEIGGVRVAQAFNRTDVNRQRFAERNLANRDANVQATAVTSAFTPALDFLSAVAIALVLGYGGYLILNDAALTLGTIVAFLTYVQQFFRPVQTLSAFYGQAQGALAGAERIFDLIDEEPELTDAPAAAQLPEIAGRIEFDRVSFAYDPDKPVLRDVNLVIEPGQTVALVGPTGAGKTTVVNLLSRFYDVGQGAIRIDGQDVREVTRASLRRQMGVVLQDSFLFAGTIRENIRYGRLDARDDEVEAAARAVNAHDFIVRLSEGYDTLLGERGGTLSQGQRQLIAFARAILAEPRILILDEATSSVDTRTEVLIQQALARLLAGRTAVVIAHRLSTIRDADQVLVMDHGQIVERGTHDELLGAGGAYAELYRRQFFRPPEDGAGQVPGDGRRAAAAPTPA